LIKSLLESAGIEGFRKNNIYNSYAIAPFASGRVRVMIIFPDYQEAREIVEDYFRKVKDSP